MAVPSGTDLRLPFLRALADGTQAHISEIGRRVAASERLSAKDLKERTRGGTDLMFQNRMRSCATNTSAAGLVVRIRRGVFRISSEGEKLLAEGPPKRLDAKFLRRFPSYRKWADGEREEPAITTDERPKIQFYGWAREYAVRGWRTGDLSKGEIRSLCGAIVELMKRVEVVEEDTE